MLNKTSEEERLYDQFLFPTDEDNRKPSELFRSPLYVQLVTTDSAKLQREIVNTLLHIPDLTLGKAVQFLEKKCEVSGKFPFSVQYDGYYHTLTLTFFREEELTGIVTFHFFHHIRIPSQRMSEYVLRLEQCSALYKTHR